MTPADEMGFDSQFEDQLRAVVKEVSLQPRLVEDLHGSEDAQSLLFPFVRGTSTTSLPSERRFTGVFRQ
jgi:hypothetical protein